MLNSSHPLLNKVDLPCKNKFCWRAGSWQKLYFLHASKVQAAPTGGLFEFKMHNCGTLYIPQKVWEKTIWVWEGPVLTPKGWFCLNYLTKRTTLQPGTISIIFWRRCSHYHTSTKKEKWH